MRKLFAQSNKQEASKFRFLCATGLACTTKKSHKTKVMDKPKPGSSTPTVAVGSNSVVIAREITNVEGKSLSLKIETVADLGNTVGHVPQADYSAQGGSVIIADKISGGKFDHVDFSVRVGKQEVHTDTTDEMTPSSQGPAVKMIKKDKVKLIQFLTADHSFILNYVHAKGIVTDRQYQNLKHEPLPESCIIHLIDQVLEKGQQSCLLFIEVLKDPEVLETYPQLKEITQNWS